MIFINFVKNLYFKLKFSDFFLWSIIFTISFYNLLLIKSASRNSNTDSFKSQIVAVIIGFLIMPIISVIDYKKIVDKWKFISFFCIMLIVYTLVFGISIKGMSGVNAKAWIILPGGFNFQPSELAKISFILSFSKHLSYLKEKYKKNEFKILVSLSFHVLVPVILTHFQGDDGAAIVFIFIAGIILFLAGIKFRFFMFLSAVFILYLPIIWNFLLAPYQKKRIINQFNPENDPLGMGYQQIQGKISIGSGGLFGKGIFRGPRVSDMVVPIQESDFILSVIGEELGFLGCIFALELIVLLIIRSLSVAKNSKNPCALYICFGFIGLILTQTVLNVGMCLGFLPVIGITLPFFSAGGSSMLCLYIGIGLIQSVCIHENLGESSRIFPI